jgi:hypothetical protein
MKLLSWFLLGCLIGLVIWLSQRRTVAKLPEKSKAAKRIVLGGALLRWVLSAALLANALLEGIFPGLAAFAGLFIFRWVGILSLRLMPIKLEQETRRS